MEDKPNRLDRFTRIGIALTIIGFLAFGFAAWMHEREHWTEEIRAAEQAKADSAWSAGGFQSWRWKK